MDPAYLECPLKFVPKPLEKTDDISKGETDWSALAQTVVITLIVIGVILFSLGVILEQTAANLSDESEIALLGWIGEEMPKFGETEDEDIRAELSRAQDILEKIIQAGDARKLPYHLALVDFDEPNAFAAPGGLIAVSPPLFDWVKSDVALAFVLAHELAHHEARHVARRLARALLIIGFQVLVESLTGQGSLGWLGELASAQYSQEQEHEADRLAIERLSLIYDDLGESTAFLERALASEEGGAMGAGLWQTHPPTEERLEKVRHLIRVHHKRMR